MIQGQIHLKKWKEREKKKEEKDFNVLVLMEKVQMKQKKGQKKLQQKKYLQILLLKWRSKKKRQIDQKVQFQQKEQKKLQKLKKYLLIHLLKWKRNVKKKRWQDYVDSNHLYQVMIIIQNLKELKHLMNQLKKNPHQILLL